MQPRKTTLAVFLIGALSVALCCTAILSNKHKAALIAEARKEIESRYGPVNHDPNIFISASVPVYEDVDARSRVDSYTIKSFLWRGTTANVEVNFHTRYSTIGRWTKKRRNYESFGTTSDTWQKLNGYWAFTSSTAGRRRDLVDGMAQ